MIQFIARRYGDILRYYHGIKECRVRGRLPQTWNFTLAAVSHFPATSVAQELQRRIETGQIKVGGLGSFNRTAVTEAIGAVFGSDRPVRSRVLADFAPVAIEHFRPALPPDSPQSASADINDSASSWFAFNAWDASQIGSLRISTMIDSLGLYSGLAGRFFVGGEGWESHVSAGSVLQLIGVENARAITEQSIADEAIRSRVLLWFSGTDRLKLAKQFTQSAIIFRPSNWQAWVTRANIFKSENNCEEEADCLRTALVHMKWASPSEVTEFTAKRLAVLLGE
ncbi:MAG: hypothetical protein NTZ10_06485 [Candidatus Saganbacteria bacterium]|nr:hypothetical protein [Candidatus Saganbacteria bacterium]